MFCQWNPYRDLNRQSIDQNEWIMHGKEHTTTTLLMFFVLLRFLCVCFAYCPLQNIFVLLCVYLLTFRDFFFYKSAVINAYVRTLLNDHFILKVMQILLCVNRVLHWANPQKLMHIYLSKLADAIYKHEQWTYTLAFWPKPSSSQLNFVF